MKQPKALIVLSRYNEDFEWITKYTDNYLIYNKGQKIEGDFKVLDVDNIGNNQRDIFHFIYSNYENLPDVMAFIQAFPFDHCNEDKFKRIIYNEELTAIESYENLNPNGASRNDIDGGYMEFNNSWYIHAHNSTFKQICKYDSFDHFMSTIFKNYQHVPWIRFSPGSQCLFPNKVALHYSKKFWKHMMDELPRNNMTEGHIIERSLWTILKGELEVVEELK